jgi:hypothetical protein
MIFYTLALALTILVREVYIEPSNMVSMFRMHDEHRFCSMWLQ